MSTAYGVIVCFAIVASCSAPAPNPRGQSVARDEIEAVLRRMEIATREEDAGGVVAADSMITIVAPDGSENTTTAVELADQQRIRWEAVLETIAVDFGLDSLQVDGNTAVVYVRQRWERVLDRPDGTVVRLTRALHRERWIRRPSGWKTRFVEILSQGPNCTDGVPDPPWADQPAAVVCSSALVPELKR